MICETTLKDKRNWLKKALSQKKITREHYESKIKELDNELDERAKNLNYPRYILETFNAITWTPKKVFDLTYHAGDPWQCADCGVTNRFAPNSILLEGKGKRLMLGCTYCGRHSIIRFKGIFRTRFDTEACLSKELNSYLSEEVTSFPTCKICGRETTKAGNLINMVLMGINDPVLFNNDYGMMCAEHAGELTERIISEKGLSASDFAKANKRATELMIMDSLKLFEKR